MPSRCAFAIVLDHQSRVLLCRRKKDGKWNLPGGEVDAGETPWDAAIREAREELAIEVEVERICAVYHVAEKDDLVLTFLCKITAGQPQSGDDVAEVRWFEPARLPQDMRERHAERVRDAIEGNGFVFRSEK